VATHPRLLLATALAGAAVFSVLPAGSSSADPRPSIQQVQQRVDALNARVDVIVEDYAASKLDLAAASRKASVAQARVRQAQAELDALQKQMGSMAAAAYRSGGADPFLSLVTTSTPQSYLDRASSLNRIAAGQSAQLALAATARHRLATVRADAAQREKAQQAVAATMAKQKTQIEDALSQQTELLGSLKAEERARLEAAQARAKAIALAQARASRERALAEARAAAAAAAPVVSTPRRSTSSTSSTPSTARPTYNGPASGRAAVAVQEAYNQLGKPYQWAAAGPDRFDCSGLTMWVWGKAGVSLPHSSRAQYSGGNKVSRGDLQPGDLVFFGSPIHHVGIYIGNGKMISAPQTGDVVKVQNAFRGDYAGAVRP
jgi:cell wall-associated NlpC family hydrolase